MTTERGIVVRLLKNGWMMIDDLLSYHRYVVSVNLDDGNIRGTHPMMLALPPTLCPRAYDPASPLPAEFIRLSLPIPFC